MLNFTRKTLLVFITSYGGPTALRNLLPRIPRLLPVPVIIAQHLPRHYVRVYMDEIRSLARMPLVMAKDGDTIAPGRILFCPGGRHSEVQMITKPRLRVMPEEGYRSSFIPCFDLLLSSAAQALGSGVIAVIMTGLSKDGVEGLQRIRALGGATIAQSPETCEVAEMPLNAIKAGAAERVVPLDGIMDEIFRVMNPTVDLVKQVQKRHGERR